MNIEWGFFLLLFFLPLHLTNQFSWVRTSVAEAESLDRDWYQQDRTPVCPVWNNGKCFSATVSLWCQFPIQPQPGPAYCSMWVTGRLRGGTSFESFVLTGTMYLTPNSNYCRLKNVCRCLGSVSCKPASTQQPLLENCMKSVIIIITIVIIITTKTT